MLSLVDHVIFFYNLMPGFTCVRLMTFLKKTIHC